MKIGVIIPSRPDRPAFIQNCLRQLSAQTIKPVEIALMDYPPESEQKDITQRYRLGYDKLRGLNLNIIALLENDDYYAPDYLETMVNAWQSHGRPDLFGTNYTIYFHLRLRSRFTMYHDQRSSAMSTLIKPDLHFSWPPDSEPYTDSHLWFVSGLRGITYKPDHLICIGMKHGEGMTGAKYHTDKLGEYAGPRATPDPDLCWLRDNTTKESFEFYSTYYAAAI